MTQADIAIPKLTKSVFNRFSSSFSASKLCTLQQALRLCNTVLVKRIDVSILHSFLCHTIDSMCAITILLLYYNRHADRN